MSGDKTFRGFSVSEDRLSVGQILALLVGCSLLTVVLAGLGDGLVDPDTITVYVKGEGEIVTSDAINAGSTTTKTQFSGSGILSLYKTTEWNETGSIQELTGTMEPYEPGAWSNRFISGASETHTGVHRTEMRSLGNTTISTSLSVDEESLSSTTTLNSSQAYFENVVEIPATNKSYLSDASRTYFEGSNVSSTLDFSATVPPGAEGDWLSCCLGASDDDPGQEIQPDWTSEDVFGYSSSDSTCSDGSCEVEEDEEIVIS